MNTNSTHPPHQDVLREQIDRSLEKAQSQKTVLKRNNSRYRTTNVILGAIGAV